MTMLELVIAILENACVLAVVVFGIVAISYLLYVVHMTKKEVDEEERIDLGEDDWDEDNWYRQTTWLTEEDLTLNNYDIPLKETNVKQRPKTSHRRG